MNNYARLAAILSSAEGFISGFEDDETQVGVVELLEDIRAAQAELELQAKRVVADDTLEAYENEAALRLPSQAQIRFPAFPEECSYVRVVDYLGNEVSYWNEDQWKQDPRDVMGALFGAAMGQSPETDMHVLVLERDLQDPNAIDTQPIIFEQNVRQSTLKDVLDRRARLNGMYGKAQIAKLVLLHL